MKIKDLFNFNKDNLFQIPYNKENSLYFYIPYFLLLGWIIFSIISIFFVGSKNLLNGFVIFSILIRISIAIAGYIFFKIIFIDRNKNKKMYNYFKAFIGYGIVFTYVFYSLPRIVGEFNGNITHTFSIFNFIHVLFISLFPAILYIFLRLGNTRLIFEVCTKKDLEFEKRIKKDKKLKKKEQKRIKSERSFLENLWYEWIDVIIQAIIIAMIIQQFLFQMYQIPTESMVPTFIIKDRVIANKFIYGPHIPLTNWKLPAFIKPKVGDIVVFNNPEMDNPDSDIKYNSVFSRIFHPFIYMLTLSLLDIDKKSNGDPKERLLVKRLIANQGEKVCMINDKVYKKRNDSDWKLMNEIKDEKEYGQVNLFYDENPKMNLQIITKQMRNILDESQNMIENYTIENSIEELKSEKIKFLNKIKTKNIFELIKRLEKLSNDYEKIKSLNGSLINELKNIFYANKLYLSNEISRSHEEIAEKLFNKYHSIIYYYYLNDFLTFLNNSEGEYTFFDNNIRTDVKIIDKDNPYTNYIKKVNALHKIYRMKLYMIIINNIENGNIDNILSNYDNFNSFVSSLTKEPYDILHKLFLISFYLYGPYLYSEDYGYNLNLFIYRNLPEFPQESYIEKDQYFMMGDNRYNSFDNRFNGIIQNKMDRYYLEILDKDDNTFFSTKVIVDWHPRTISLSHVLGKAKVIYWPPERFKIFK